MSRKFIIAVFNNADAAYGAAADVKTLEGNKLGFKVKAGGLMAKDGKGNPYWLDEKERPLWGTLVGTVVGGLLGLMAGPAGAAAGATLGATSGLVGDALSESFDADDVEWVTAQLSPGKAAMVLDAEEDSPVYFDEIAAKYGAIVRRDDA